MKNISKFLKSITEGKYILALATTVDTTDEEVLNKFYRFHDIELKDQDNRELLSKVADEYLNNFKDFKDFFLETKGYWEGRENPNSYFIAVTKEEARDLVNSLAEELGQDSVMAFGPDNTFTFSIEPKEYATKVDNFWITFNLDGTYFETGMNFEEEPKDLLSEAKQLITIPDNYTAEDLIDVVMQAAPNIYKTKDWSTIRNYTVDDFVQDASMYIWNKFTNKKEHTKYYAGKTGPEAVGTTIGMLKGFFINNIWHTKLRQNKQKPASLDKMTEDAFQRDGTHAGLNIADKSMLNPEQLYELEIATEEHEELSAKAQLDLKVKNMKLKQAAEPILKELLNHFNKTPYVTRKYDYIADIEYLGKNIKMSPYIITSLILTGYNRAEIIELFSEHLPKTSDVEYHSHNSASSYIAHRYRAVFNDLDRYMNELPDNKRKTIKDYIEVLDFFTPSQRAIN